MRANEILSRLNPFRSLETVSAHCDIPCGVYDPEQARIEAESCKKIIGKYHDSDDEVFRARCIHVKEERAELAKHHIDVLWSDWYKPDKMGEEHHETFNQAVKACSDVKRSMDASDADRLLELIDQIDELWKSNNGPSETRVNGRPG
ncbi:MAG: superoxide dismutase, Ni [Nitriliruptorales bacterium]|nr:superoxide dismutase, Ni [Nitriliruptorales bacterium]